jgi:hypothetical protein
MLGLRKLRDVGPGIFERDELEAAGQHDRVVERARLGTRPPIMRHPLAAIKPAVLLQRSMPVNRSRGLAATSPVERRCPRRR